MWLPMDFEIWASSRSFRRDNEALLGSGVADERARDPGIRKIIGDLKKLLAGSTLGLEPGVDFVQIGTHTQKVQSLSEAEFTDVLRIRVLASVQIPDEPGEDYEPPPAGALYLQRQFAERDADGTVTLTPIGDADPIPR